jgi:hypothetical protein
MNPKLPVKTDLLDAEYDVSRHARRLSEALEGLRWGLSRRSHQLDMFTNRAARPLEIFRRQPLYVSIPIVVGTVIAAFFGTRAFRRRRLMGDKPEGIELLKKSA